MGGMGSGRHWRWGEKSTTDSFRQLDVRRWARDGYLAPGASFRWRWQIEGETVASINVRVETERAWLRYKVRDAGDEWEDMNYAVRLLSQPCHLGGKRQWFECPARGCNKRAAILYGGRVFACRICHDLAYPSQREKKFLRAQRRADKVKRSIGWETGCYAGYGPKPKHMHWKTFGRLVDEIERHERIAGMVFAQYTEDMPERLSTLL